jgi:lipopolysaccharide/colanic/teichoic acid biosynthesis glycosyltransferase
VAPRLDATLSFGVGGLFDFLSRRIPRAPAFMRQAGLEWTYRLYQEPKRMFRRYIMGNPAFVARVITARLALRERAERLTKRGLDIAGAAAGLALLALPFLAIAAAVRLGSPGPALLRQIRIGEDGKPFTLYKFRSMYRDADARLLALRAENQHGTDGVTFKMKRDPRVTAFGRLLRKSSVDELPQLLNVLNGSMSLVGPRPALPSEVARYNGHERGRLRGKPGITGLWQVSGRADIPFPRQVELDIEYLQCRNLILDIGILLRTVPAVLLARGAY